MLATIARGLCAVCLALCVWLMAGVCPAIANEPFEITADSTSGTPRAVTQSGSSLPDLFSNLIKDQSAFASLKNQGVSASLRYGGVANAITVTKNAGNTSATVSIPSIGFNKTFTGKDQNDLKNQIVNFAEKNGADIYGRFLKSIDQTSDLGLIDGNPLAATAVFADQAYRQFGLATEPFALGPANADSHEQVSTPNIRFDLSGGVSRSASGNGTFASGAVTLGFKFNDRVGLTFATPFEYRELEGSDSFVAGEEISLPILAIKPGGNNTLSWQITPSFISGGAGSLDLASGGTFLGGAATSSLSYQLDSFVFTLADNFSYFHGIPIGYDKYKLDTNLEQEILKNGIKVTKFFGDHAFIDAGVTYSNFLRSAEVSNYWTPSAGLGIRFNPNAGLRIGYEGDFGRGFTVHGGEVQLYFNY